MTALPGYHIKPRAWRVDSMVLSYGLHTVHPTILSSVQEITPLKICTTITISALLPQSRTVPILQLACFYRESCHLPCAGCSRVPCGTSNSGVHLLARVLFQNIRINREQDKYLYHSSPTLNGHSSSHLRHQFPSRRFFLRQDALPPSALTLPTH